MFPYKDENPTVLPPVITVGIIVLNVLAWALVHIRMAARAAVVWVSFIGVPLYGMSRTR